MTQQEKMTRVLELAETALQAGELPIAAIVFQGDEILSEAYTSEHADKRLLVHAELKALLEADRAILPVPKRKKLELYTNLEPCMMCLGAAMTAFVGEIVYSLEADDGATRFAEKLLENNAVDSIPSYAMPRITGGIMREESRALFGKYAEIYADSPLAGFARMMAQM